MSGQVKAPTEQWVSFLGAKRRVIAYPHAEAYGFAATNRVAVTLWHGSAHWTAQARIETDRGAASIIVEAKGNTLEDAVGLLDHRLRRLKARIGQAIDKAKEARERGKGAQ